MRAQASVAAWLFHLVKQYQNMHESGGRYSRIVRDPISLSVALIPRLAVELNPRD
jgi:hypothetical protein